MNVRDIMCDGVVTCSADDTLETPARLMWENDFGSVPVVEAGGRVVGVVTDRDICMAAWTQGRSLAEIPVRTAMSSQVHACSILDTLDAVERIMQEQCVRRVPVVDDERRIVGIVSLNDIAIAALDGLGSDGASVSTEELARTFGSVCRPRAASTDAREPAMTSSPAGDRWSADATSSGPAADQAGETSGSALGSTAGGSTPGGSPSTTQRPSRGARART